MVCVRCVGDVGEITGSRGHAYFLGSAEAKQVGGGPSVRRLE